VPKKLIDLDLAPEEVPKIWSLMPKNVIKLLEILLGVHEINKSYDRFIADTSDCHFATKFSRAFGFQFEVETENFFIPKTGPLIVIANHAYLPADGMVLASMLSRFRADGRALVNVFFKHVLGSQKIAIFASPLRSAYAQRLNSVAVRLCERHLMRERSLLIFPSGQVSTLSWRTFRQEERLWRATVAFLARKTNAAVLPVFIEGSHSLLFQLVFLINPRLANLLLLREAIRAKKCLLKLKVGEILSADSFERYKTDEELTNFFREQLYSLR
tara:strand:+ start:417 stop:1232 length:816 start_codon:yes stop_codon:yes gene_type:complete